MSATIGEDAEVRAAFGRLLRQHRESAGLRQERLAEQAGLSTPAISNLERGINRPRLETVNLLAGALALSEDQRAALLAAALGEQAVPAAPERRQRHNLPIPPNALIGRDGEVAAVRARLQAPVTRLLTLSGAGGVGKTRLALAVGAELVEHFPDGVWLADLAPLTGNSFGGVPPVHGAVAAVLRLRDEPGRPLMSTLVEQLRDRQLLLLLDNCEHLLDACAALASALLRGCPGVRLLATSRERLGVSGEQVYAVPPLSVPEASQLPPLDLEGSYDAVRLFVQRAQARRGEFTLGPENARAVAAICARLDGIPLAIELAAARAGGLPVQTIAERLDERFGLLTTGPRDAPPRQRTLRATMDWSWDLLEGGERALLRRLAVFAGGWTLEAAEVVCAGGENITTESDQHAASPGSPHQAEDTRTAQNSVALAAGDVLNLLCGLVEKSLVQVEQEGARYRLLETVRQYAGERLAEAGELAALQQRHLAWCVALAEGAEPELRGGEPQVTAARLAIEHDNLRAALGWAQGRGAGGHASRLAGALWRFWYLRGHIAEGRRWLEAALSNETQGTRAERARALNGAGVLAGEQGDFGQAAAYHEKALQLWRELGDTQGIAGALNNLGKAAGQLGDLERAACLFQESLALRRELGDLLGIAGALNNLGLMAYDLGEMVQAAALHEEALALRRSLGDKQGIAGSLHNLGIVAAAEGDHRRATALYEESLALDQQLGHRRGVANTLENLAQLAYQQADTERAARLFRESLRIGRDLGARDMLASVLDGMARLAAECGRPRHAARLGGAAQALGVVDGGCPMPERRADHEQVAIAVRAALGEEVFAATWAEGRALPLEAAVALALEDSATG